MDTDISPKIIDRIRKLLALAGNNPSEAEANAAINKAHELLAEFNLNLADIQKSAKPTDPGEAAGPRMEQKMRGGFYLYQQTLWGAVARLNFCAYFIQTYYVDKAEGKPEGWTGKGSRWKRQRRHLIIGREHNILATQMMAEYLEQTLERLVREELEGRFEDVTRALFTRWAISWREGCADRLAARLNERLRKLREPEVKAEAASSGTAMVLASFYKQEKDANEGFAMERYKIGKGSGRSHKEQDGSAYSHGYRKGGDIGLDTQLGTGSPKGSIEGGA